MNTHGVIWTQNIHVPGLDKAPGRDAAYFSLVYDKGGLKHVEPVRMSLPLTSATEIHKWIEGLQAVNRFMDQVEARKRLNQVDYITALISLEADKERNAKK